MPAHDQEFVLRFYTPDGDTKLRDDWMAGVDRKIFPVSLEGTERISAIFEYLVTVRVKDGFLWEKGGKDDKDRITRLVEGGWAGVRFQKKQRQGQTDESSRQIAGRVHDLTVEPDGEGFELVTFKIRPELAKLARLKRTRSIQDSAKWREAVIDKLLKGAGISSFQTDISGHYGAKQEYDFRLQYRESDLEFLLRECALHGVAFFWSHAVSADPSGPDNPIQSTVFFKDHFGVHDGSPDSFGGHALGAHFNLHYTPVLGEGATGDPNMLTRWRVTQRATPAPVAVAVRAYDNNYALARGAGSSKITLDCSREDSAVSLCALKRPITGEAIDSWLERRKKLLGDVSRLEETVVEAWGGLFCHPGSTVEVDGVRLAGEPAQTRLRVRQQRLRAIVDKNGDCSVESTLELVPLERQCLSQWPLPPKPIVAGVAGARVLGDKEGHPAVIDAFGRVRVCLHEDQAAPMNIPGLEVSEAMKSRGMAVRVSQFWAGKDHGAYFHPRAGAEVLVAFEHGDPDRPYIVGSLYNDINKIPHNPQNFPWYSGIRSKTEPGNGDKKTLLGDVMHHEICMVDDHSHRILLLQAARTLVSNYFYLRDNSTRGARRHRGNLGNLFET